MSEDRVNFLGGLYDPPLRRTGSLDRNLFRRAKAAAWGEALHEWLEGYSKEKTRRACRFALASLLSFCFSVP